MSSETDLEAVVTHSMCADCRSGGLLARALNADNEIVIGAASDALLRVLGREAVLHDNCWGPTEEQPAFTYEEKAAGVRVLTDPDGPGAARLGRIGCDRTWGVDQDGPVCYCLADVEYVPVPAAFASEPLAETTASAVQ